MRLLRYAPIKFNMFRDRIADHAILEAVHFNRQLVKLGKVRDTAKGVRRAALNDALHIMLAPRRFNCVDIQKKEPKRPLVERKKI